jgi:hypothetical protein
MNQACTYCGATLRPGRKFCVNCGRPIGATAPAPVTQPSMQPPRRQPTAADAAPPRPPLPPKAPVTAEKYGAGRLLWDVFSVVGCGALAGLWYWYSGLAETAPDKKTCIAIAVLPIAMIVLRPLTDRLLRPLEPIKEKIPRMVRLGIGVGMPFLVSNFLYARGYSQFDYMFKTVVASTLLSYIVLRTPPRPATR